MPTIPASDVLHHSDRKVMKTTEEGENRKGGRIGRSRRGGRSDGDTGEEP